MAEKAKKGPRWSRPQEDLFLELLCKFPPIGGEDDGVMGRKQEKVWAPLQEELEKRLPAVNQLPNQKKGELKTDFSKDVLIRKWRDWNGLYKRTKLKHDIIRHSPKTGAAVEEGDKKIEDRISAATKDWWPFRTFHQFFGGMARNNTALVDEGLHEQPPVTDAIGASNTSSKIVDTSGDVKSDGDSDLDVVPKKGSGKRLRLSTRNVELTAFVQDKKTKSDLLLVDAKKQAGVERDSLKAQAKLTLYRDIMHEQELMSAKAVKEKRVDKFVDAYMSAGSSPGTAMRKAREAVLTPVKKYPE